MRLIILVAALLVAFVFPVEAKDRDEKFERLISAMTVAGHCDLELVADKGAAYYASFHVKTVTSVREEYDLVALVMAVAQLKEVAWDDKPERATLCSNLVRWFGPNGSELAGMMTGSGKPLD